MVCVLRGCGLRAADAETTMIATTCMNALCDTPPCDFRSDGVFSNHRVRKALPAEGEAYFYRGDNSFMT